MGKQNKKNNNKDPMSNTKTMGREGMRIIRDIAFGRYDIYSNGHIFRNLEFVKATLYELDKKLMDAKIHVAAISYAYRGNQDPNILSLLHRDTRSVEAYELIRKVLCSIIASNGDTGFLLVLANKLPEFRYNI